MEIYIKVMQHAQNLCCKFSSFGIKVGNVFKNLKTHFSVIKLQFRQEALKGNADLWHLTAIIVVEVKKYNHILMTVRKGDNHVILSIAFAYI